MGDQDFNSDTSACLELSILDSVSKDNILDILGTAAELSLDKILESEELKEIPVFGTLIKLVKVGANVRDRLFARKLIAFLAQVSSVPHEKRIKFVNKLSSKVEKRHAGEAILLLLERLDDMAKPEIVGKIVRAAILGEIDYETSIKLSAMVDRAYITDLLLLPKSETGSGIPGDVAESLASVGLLERRVEPDILGVSGTKVPNITFYSLSNHGRALVKILSQNG